MVPSFRVPAFRPLFANPHVATIAANFWPRAIDEVRFPAVRRVYEISPGIAVVCLEHQPSEPRAQILLLHGLEGSAHAGYLRSMTMAALAEGFGVHRLNLRTCGGTEDLCETMYHSGLTADTFEVLQRLKARFGQPLFLVGFSLGGNVVLKLAGEYDSEYALDGVCAVSSPIDLADSVSAIDRKVNFFYSRRFLNRLKQRIQRKSLTSPHLYSTKSLAEIRNIREFDDRYTAPLFGFGTAAEYYRTQSAQNFLHRISVPTLLIAAQDDPIVPFAVYRQPVFEQNPNLQLISPKHGGHLGFLSRGRRRFWLDEVVLRWASTLIGTPAREQEPPNLRLSLSEV